METFSESIDLDALQMIDKRIAEVIDKTPNEESVRKRTKIRRSKTVNESMTSDADVIDDSPINCERVTSLRDVRDKINRNQTIRPLKRVLKRNKSDSVIRRSANYLEPLDDTVEQARNAPDLSSIDPESIDFSRLKSLLRRAEAATAIISPQNPSLLVTDTDKRLLDLSEFSVVKSLGRKVAGSFSSPILAIGPTLKRQRSDDVPLLRLNSDTPVSSQETMNLPIMHSQDLDLIDANLLESTAKVGGTEYLQNIDEDDALEMQRSEEIVENMDHENITFTKQQNTMEMFHLAADLRGLTGAAGSPDTFSQSCLIQSALLTKPDASLSVTNKYSQKVSKEPNRSIVDVSLNLKLIASWNLPQQIEREYKKKGIVEMFEWQVQCLNNPRVLLENKNLVYSAPTSAGKTLVSEILMMKSVLERKKKALLILPFVSVVREKMFYLQDLLTSSGIRVDGFFGGYSPPGGFEGTQLAICTIEKANSIVNKLLEQNKLDSLGIIVVDEIHLIGDPNRGYILELLLAKVLYMNRKHPAAIQIQIVSMSATLPKLELLCEWLQADMFVTDFRPVALTEMIKVNRSLYNNKMELIRTLDPDNNFPNDQDNIAQMCLETIAEKCSVIVFCPTKDRCEKLALSVAEAIYNILKKDTEFAEQIRAAMGAEKLAEVKSQIKLNCPTGLDEVLSKTISYGCAFHHASLTMEERDIIETSFKSGALKLIAATSTLSSGVNLPARRVIIRTPMFGGKVMNSLVYKQMIGRAGRTGKDTVGESILVCTEQNKKMGEELVMAKLQNPVTSCLVTRGSESEEVEYNMNNMKRAVLEIIASGGATTNDDLKLFVQSTLFFVEHKDLFENLDFDAVAKQHGVTKGIGKYPGQWEEDSEENSLLECVKFLIEYEFVRIQLNKQEPEGPAEVHFFATRLGLACLSSSLPPADGFLLFSELQRSRQCFVLESELHAIYLVTPYSVCNQMSDIDWLLFLDMWEKLPVPLQRVGELVGIKDSFIVKAMRAIKKVDYKLMQIHKRFFIALALQELVNEVSITVVAGKFKVSRGILQSLQQMAGTFAGIVTAFCNSLNWSMLGLIVAQFKERLFFGIHPDLMDLMRIPSLNSQRARALQKNGIETLLVLAQTSAFVIEKILYDQVEFQSEKRREGELEYEAEERNKIRSVYVTGRMGLTVKEGAALVIKEAQEFLEMEMGLNNIKWRSQVLEDVIVVTNDKVPVPLLEGEPFNVAQKPPLKRHSTEELLDVVVVDPKRNKNGDQHSYGAKFSSDLFDFESVPQCKVENEDMEKRRTDVDVIEKQVYSTEEVLDSDAEETEDDAEQEVINRSHLMNAEKCEKEPPVNLSKIRVVNVCGDLSLFKSFKKLMVDSKDCHEVGLAVGVTVIPETEANKEPEVLIGGNVMMIKRAVAEKEKKKDPLLSIDEKYQLSGICICSISCLGVAFYLDLHSDTVVTWEMKVDLVCTLFMQKKLKIFSYHLKEQLRILLKVIPGLVVGPEVRFADPKIANWLMMALSTDHGLNSLSEMVKMYTPEYTHLLELLCYDETKKLYASGLNADNPIRVQSRAAIESVLVQRIIKYQELSMDPDLAAKVFKTFDEVEMPMQVVLAVMECTGIRIHRDRWENLVDQMKDAATKLERQIYAAYGKKFNLRSTKELKRVLGLVKESKMTVKEALEGKNTELNRLITQHRKIGGVLHKMVYPMARNIFEDKITCQNLYFTATGRINMADPSIQTLAKDFRIDLDPTPITVSLRSLFEPRPGTAPRCFVSADFCQLELRILAHFCEDKALVKILKSNHDVFQAIAAKWNNVAETNVTEELRNDTKQMCYGMIYGMGVRSLATALRVDESTAQQRIEEFHKTYPGIRKLIEKVLAAAREKGYVETLNGRRRYFPYLQDAAEEVHNKQQMAVEAQYERQIVNTMIQGSAADILKMAILKIQQAIRKRKVSGLRVISEVPINTNKKLMDASCAVMVLHLHDEVMFEIPGDKVKAFSRLLRQAMESAASLKVPLRVKVKSGPNWGQLKEVS